MKSEKYTDYMFNLIKKVVDEIGPREPCSDAEKKLADVMAEEWRPICDRVDVEPFTCSPTAFLGFLPFTVLFYIASLAFYWVFPPAALLLVLVGVSLFIFEFVRYVEYVDFLYPKKESLNVAGIIRPTGEVRRRVIVSGHMDSAYEFTLWYFLKKAAIPVMITGVVAAFILLGACAGKTYAYFTGGADALIFNILGYACIALYPIMGLNFFFHTYTPVPGAMDDMAGVAVAAGLGKYLHDAKSDGSFFPKNTEVVLLGAGCEEAGLRGAKRYAKRHLKEMKDIPTSAIFFDGIYDERFLTVINWEICPGARHSAKLVKMAREVAAERKWPMKNSVIPLGASDAAAFSRAGVPSVCILCQDNTRLVENYHTRHDTVDYIRPQSLAVSLQLAIDMLKRIDEEK